MKYEGPRYQLIGPRCQIVKVERGELGMKIHIKVPGAVWIWDCPTPDADVNAGADWVTLYTEIPIKARQ